MKSLYLVLLGIILSVSFFAQCVEPPIPPVTLDSIPERIRSTPAVDPYVMGTGTKFYVTTFGLERFDDSIVDNNDHHVHRERAPLPKPGCIVRFGIQNSVDPFPWSFTNLMITTMDDPPFDALPLNCYNTDDQNKLESDYPTPLIFTDGSPGTEGFMRYESGRGFWSSPILYKDSNGVKHLITLNKSGCLMSVKITDSEYIVDWTVNLREEERSFDNDYPDNITALFEFI
jgi:hypothetical protein